MKKFIKRVLSVFIAVAMIVTVMPFAGLQMKASAASYIFPVTGGGYISQNFSNSHGGIDIAGCAQYPVVATSTGTVIRVDNNCTHTNYSTAGCTKEHNNTCGNCVYIQHDGTNYVSVYGHLYPNSICVQVGQKVQAGEKIGQVGSSGMSTGYHLHFEIRPYTDNYWNWSRDSENINTSNISYVYLNEPIIPGPIKRLKPQRTNPPSLIQRFSYNGTIYEAYASTLTWEQSKTWCENNGGHLATITSGADQTAINYFVNQYDSLYLFLGAENTSGTWKWVTGEPFSYTYWGSGQPDGLGGSEHFLGTYKNGEWNDFTNGGSDAIWGFICEKDADGGEGNESTGDYAGVKYCGNTKNYGGYSEFKDGETMGTPGESMFSNLSFSLYNCSGGISYSVHLSDIGWTNYESNGNLAGTTGQSTAIEAIKIKLTGDAANKYRIYYRSYVNGKGWYGWTSNDGISGTTGAGLHISAVQAMLVPKVKYNAHVSELGWVGNTYDGEQAGTTGQVRACEAFYAEIADKNFGDIEYIAHSAEIGWGSGNYVRNGRWAGTSGLSLQMEAFKVRLTGEAANRFDVAYNAHCQDYQWTGWVYNGEGSGTTGKGKQLEALKIKIIPKGAKIEEKANDIFTGNSLGIKSLTFNANGGSFGYSTMLPPTNSEYILPGSLPTKSGYVFAGWYKNSDFSGTAYMPYDVIKMDADYTLHAKWVQSSYTLTYDTNGGDSASWSTPVTRGDEITLSSEVPTRIGYDFVCWNTRADGRGAIYSPGDTFLVIGEESLYAIWREKKYSVIWDNEFDFDRCSISSASNGTITKNNTDNSILITSNNSDCFTIPYSGNNCTFMMLIPGHTYSFSYQYENMSAENATLSFFRFAFPNEQLKWSECDYAPGGTSNIKIKGRDTGICSGTFTVPEGKPYVTVRFGIIEAQRTVKFSAFTIKDITDGAGDIDYIAANYSDSQYSFREEIGTMPVPERHGYSFDGWYTGINGEGEKYTENTAVTSNIHLYPKWIKSMAKVTWDNEFDFDNYDLSGVDNGNCSVNYVDRSITLTSLDNDCFTASYSKGHKGFMTLVPGHTYSFSYKYENQSDKAATLKFFHFTYKDTLLYFDSDCKFASDLLSVAANSNGIHSGLFNVPEGRPYVTIRFGVDEADLCVKFSDLIIKDVTGSISDKNYINNRTEGTECSLNTELTSMPTPVRSGYTFLGWYTGKNGTGTKYTESTSITEDVHLYSYWVKDECTVSFDNEFDFSNYVFKSAVRGSITVNTEEESVTINSTGNDAYTAEYSSNQPGYMILIPGHTYHISYKYRNYSDNSVTLRYLTFSSQSEEMTDFKIGYFELPSVPAKSNGTHTLDFTVPEGKPYTTFRFGVGEANSTVKFSDLYIHDITNSNGNIDNYVPAVSSVKCDCYDTFEDIEALNGTLPSPERTGYMFCGWYTGKNGTGTRYNNTMPIENNLKLYSYWLRTDFWINYESDMIFDNGIIYGFTKQTSAEELRNSFENDNVIVSSDSNRIGTGITVSLVDGSESVYKTVTVVIFGDVNGDGWYDGTDAMTVKMLANGMLAKENVSEAVYMAADCNHDGVIDNLDVEVLEQAGLLLADVDQRKSEEELLETAAYVEYLNLIDQTVESETIEVIEDEPVNPVSNPLSKIISLVKDLVAIIKAAVTFIKADLPGLPFSFKK